MKKDLKKQPQLRFPKFNDDWEQRKLGDITVKIGSGKTPSGGKNAYVETGIPLIRSQNVNGDKVDFADIVFIDEATDESMANSRVYTNDVLLNITGASIGRSAVYKGLESANVNQHVCIIRPTEGYQPDFIQLNLSSDNGQKQIDASQAGGGREGLNFQEIRKMQFSFPSLNEQKCIGRYFNSLDHLITLHQRKLDKLKEMKKGVMQKLFTQEVRFKADDGSKFPDWEEKSFEQVFSNLNNSTFSRDCLNYENGNVKYIHYGDILVKFGATVNVTDCIVPYVKDDLNCERYNILEDGDVVIADTAEDATVGKVVEIRGTDSQETISGLHTIACRPNKRFAPKYLGYFMNSDTYHNQLRPYMQGVKVTSISKANIKLTSILIPCLAEQQKIADCLSALDDVIEKQKATLAAWEEMKKGLLQQMFM